MPKGLLQEKFQRTLPDPETDGGNEWANLSDAAFQRIRKVAPQPMTRISAQDRPGAPATASFDSPVTNRLPPGVFIDNQQQADIRSMEGARVNLAGSSDESNAVNKRMLSNGFQLQRMEGTDDLYTNEHIEEFYGEARGEDDAGNKYAGFLERNNYLDRT